MDRPGGNGVVAGGAIATKQHIFLHQFLQDIQSIQPDALRTFLQDSRNLDSLKNMRNVNGDTALHLVVQTRLHGLVQKSDLLEALSKIVDINVQNNAGNTAVHSALLNNDLYSAESLLLAQLDRFIVNRQNHAGQSVMHLVLACQVAQTPLNFVEGVKRETKERILGYILKKDQSCLSARYMAVDARTGETFTTTVKQEITRQGFGDLLSNTAPQGRFDLIDQYYTIAAKFLLPICLAIIVKLVYFDKDLGR
jgi:hypothetical protein